MLDLFCGGGLAAWGYWLSGRFSEIVGVDIENNRRSSYSFDFVNADALKLDYEFLSQFDFVHASPPCQGYSRLTRGESKKIKAIAAVKQMLYASGLPHVVENVEGAIRELRPNLAMDGHYFNLPSERRRYFYVSTLTAPQRLMKSGHVINVHASHYVQRSEIIRALGLEMINGRALANISVREMEEGIPPAMTKHIAEIMFPRKFLIG